jgi:hypothetical protein
MATANGRELPLVNGMYEFTPTTVTYRIPADSSIGKVISGCVGVIVVHQKDGAPWDGRSGLENRGNVAILTPTAGVKFTLSDPIKLSKAATDAVAKEGKSAEDFLKGMDKVSQNAIKTYFNQLITAQTQQDIYTWLQDNVSGKQFRLLVGENSGGYLYRNHKGFQSLVDIWNAIYQLKINLVSQLEPQIKGFEQWTGGQRAGEGFVVNTSQDLVKLVNRGVFGAAHFNK